MFKRSNCTLLELKGVTQGAVSQWESGSNCTLLELKGASRAAGGSRTAF